MDTPRWLHARRIVILTVRSNSMAKEEDHRHEQQAIYGYFGQANAGIGHSNKRGAAASTPGLSRDRAKITEEEALNEERGRSNRAWDTREVTELLEAVDQ